MFSRTKGTGIPVARENTAISFLWKGIVFMTTSTGIQPELYFIDECDMAGRENLALK